jgi:CO/xanthine dehydrogenase Mo-binding subunit
MTTKGMQAPPITRYVGRSLPTRGAEEVVTGVLEYLTDKTFPDMLYGKIVGSPVPHGHLRRLDTGKARSMPGVAAVLTAAEVPENIQGVIVTDQPVMVEDHIRQFGEPVAIVAAATLEMAEAAAKAVVVEIDPLPVVSDPDAALLADAPRLHPNGNLLVEFRHQRGDVVNALAGAAHVVERMVDTPCQEHVCLEPGGGVGVYENGLYTLWFGTQLPGNTQREVARALKVDPGDIRVISTPMGGAFGAKEDGPVAIFLALLAKATRRPVRITLTREEVMATGSKRHPFRIKTRIGFDSDGNIVGLDTDAVVDGGPYASFSPSVFRVAAEASSGPYRIPAARFHGRVAYTNNGNSGGFRGYGVPQVAFALETALDVAAVQLGIDPIELRLRNALRPGDPHGLYGHEIEAGFKVAETLEAIADHTWYRGREGWKAAAEAPWRRGTGVASALKGCGYGAGRGDTAGARLAIGVDGSIRIWAGPNHSGQFIETAYAQIAADALGRPYEEIELIVGDSEMVPESGAAAASRSTYMGGSAVLSACNELVSAIHQAGISDPIDWAEAGRRLAANGGALIEVSFRAPEVEGLEGVRPEDLGKYSPHRVYGTASQVARVEVNEMTGEVVVRGVACAVDCGVAINPAGVIGQTEGGIIQGMGYALMEEFLLRDGVPATRSLETYLIPTAADTPEMDVILVEGEETTGPFGAKGIAEVVLAPTAPAIVAAIHDAIGCSADRIPVTPERIYRMIQESDR